MHTYLYYSTYMYIYTHVHTYIYIYYMLASRTRQETLDFSRCDDSQSCCVGIGTFVDSETVAVQLDVGKFVQHMNSVLWPRLPSGKLI